MIHNSFKQETIIQLLKCSGRLCSIAVILMSSIMLVPLASAQSGGPYDLTWNTVCDAGGGTSSAGSYSLTGTIGQSDAGSEVKSGGNYEHISGFWVIPLSVTGEIFIYCYKDGNDVRIEWVPITGITLYDVYYDTVPGDPDYFNILDANVTTPYYHVGAIADPDEHYYDVRPAP